MQSIVDMSFQSFMTSIQQSIANISLQQIIFYAFAALAIAASGMVIISKNPVRAVLFLVLTFFSTAVIWMLLEAEFLSVTLVLVYVGAVMVLFLFVVMMLDVELASIREGFARYLPLGLLVSVVVTAGLIYVVGPNNFGLEKIALPKPHPAVGYSNVQVLGTALYTDYLYPFLIAGVLLLVAMVAAISLTFRGRRDSLAPNPSKQVKVRRNDRVRLVSITPDSSIQNLVPNQELSQVLSQDPIQDLKQNLNQDPKHSNHSEPIPSSLTFLRDEI